MRLFRVAIRRRLMVSPYLDRCPYRHRHNTAISVARTCRKLDTKLVQAAETMASRGTPHGPGAYPDGSRTTPTPEQILRPAFFEAGGILQPRFRSRPEEQRS